METLVIISTIFQAITAIVIAIATVVYTRVTLRMFQAGIEPNVDVDLTGSSADNQILVHNDAGCTINDLCVSVNIGTEKDGESYGIMRCIYQHTWPILPAGSAFQTNQSPLTELEIFGDDDNLPEGVNSNPHDIVVTYSFQRAADSRRFNYRYRVATSAKADGGIFYMPMEEPEQVTHLKEMIVQRTH